MVPHVVPHAVLELLVAEQSVEQLGENFVGPS